jgi:hypothetical protein
MEQLPHVRTTVIHLQAERTMPAAIAALMPTLTRHFSGSVIILPSSLEHDDPVAEAVGNQLPPKSEVSIATPMRGGAARRAFFLPAGIGTWREVSILAAGASTESVLLPEPIANAAHRLIVVDVVEVARRGPFALDLAARYVHPRQRLRLVADHQRSSIVVEVTSVAMPTLSVVSFGMPGGALVAVTDDIIAAELVSLALAERCIGARRAFTGPWEDDVVQRATELELGVLMPGAIEMNTLGGAAHEPWAVELLEHLGRRLGLSRP